MNNIDQELLRLINSVSITNYKQIEQEIENLLKRGANPNIIDEQNQQYTLLCIASENGYYNIVKLLLEYGADPNLRNTNGSTTLMSTSGSDDYTWNTDIIRLLLEYGADPNIIHQDYGTAILIAIIWNGTKDAIELLLEYGAKLNTCAARELHISLRLGKLEITKFLLEMGEDPNIQDINGNTAMAYARDVRARNLLERYGGI